MDRIRRLITLQHDYVNPVDRRRALGLLWISLILMAFWALTFLVTYAPALLSGQPLGDMIFLITMLATPAALWFAYRSVQNGKVGRASTLFVGFLLVAVASLIPAGIRSGDYLYFVLPLTAAGMLMGQRSTLIVAAIILALLVIAGLIAQTLSPDFLWFHFIASTILIMVIAAFLIFLNGDTTKIVSQALVEVDQIQRIIDFDFQAESRENAEAVMAETINMLRDRLGYSDVYLHLMDENGRLNRRVRSAMGMGILSVPYEQELSASSAIYEAVRIKTAVVVSRRDSLVRRIHLLPAVNAGVAIPLIYRDQVLGVLDVQSEQQDAFGPTQVAILTLVANQTALLLAHLEERALLRQQVTEQESVIGSLRTQLQELRRLGRRDIASAWEDYLQGRGTGAVGYDLEGAALIPAYQMPEALLPALSSGDLHIEKTADEQVINVPIILAGQTLGAMAFSVPADQPVTERQLEMARAVANRLAQSLETKRLFEQSQAQALRERKASETANLLISATDVQSVMNIAAESFNEALGAISTSIYLRPRVLADMRNQPAVAGGPEGES